VYEYRNHKHFVRSIGPWALSVWLNGRADTGLRLFQSTMQLIQAAKVLFLAVLLNGVFAFAQSPQAARSGDQLRNIQFGLPIPIGNGFARAYIKYSDSHLVEVGVSLTTGVMEGLPNELMGHQHEYLAHFPPHNPTVYTHITMHWNYKGHRPVPYLIPHFDFHFNMISETERKAITSNEAQGTHYPPPLYLPRSYAPAPPISTPEMGVHWSSSAAEELHDIRFTQTLLYGTWDGRVVFVEPMITREFLMSKPDVTIPIAMPEKYAAAGIYATAYIIRWNKELGEYQVALTSFVRKPVADGILSDISPPLPLAGIASPDSRASHSKREHEER
jgi:hypothetical protein